MRQPARSQTVTSRVAATSRAALAVFVLFVAACGSGGGSDESERDVDPPTPEPTAQPTPPPGPSPSAVPPPSPSPARDDFTGCIAPARPALGGELLLETWIDDEFHRPLALVQPPGESEVWYVVGQRGLIWRVEDDGDEQMTGVALDWQDRTVDPDATQSWEAGLLGLAFHPAYPADRRAFVSATLTNEPGCPLYIVAELLVDASGALDPDPNRILFEARTTCTFTDFGPRTIHHGGTLHFDPADGRLVFGVGDMNQSSDAGDPDQIEGSLLWLDVDAPLLEEAGELPELRVPGGVIAYGFRNPWKWSFDRETGEIWMGDVGSARREEINRVVPGRSHGWPHWEGDLCRLDDCDDEPHEPPLFTYDHGNGCSVTGGYVYRGTAVPELFGTYLFADWCAGLVWGLFPVDDGYEAGLVADLAGPASACAEDQSGELYIVDHHGSVLRIVGFQAEDRPGFPRRLSETSCVDGDDPSLPAETLIAYDLNVPFWSDGAGKRRWLSVPPGEQVVVTDDGDFTFPAGTVLMKEFILGGRRVETRLFVNHGEAGWHGYSYAWEEDDAFLVGPFGERRRFDDIDREWIYPARRECLRCHTEDAGRALGPEVAQLDRPAADASLNQLEMLVDAGVLDPVSLQASNAPTFAPSDERPVDDVEQEAAARAYLHTNCSFCHQPGSRSLIQMDLRASTPLADTGLCGAEATLPYPDLRDPLRIAPGEPDQSVVLQRMKHPEDRRMPPLASLDVDEGGSDLIERWIASQQDCPSPNAADARLR